MSILNPVDGDLDTTTPGCAIPSADPLLAAILNSPTDVAIVSIGTDFQCLFANHVLQSLMIREYGQTIEIGQNLRAAITIEADREIISKHFDRALSGEAHTSIEKIGGGADGLYEFSFSPLRDEDGVTIGATAFGRNVFEQQRKEEESRRRESFITTVLENFPLIFYMIDRDGFFKLSVGAGLKSLGLLQNQVVGMSVFDIYRDYPTILDAVKRAIAGEFQHFESEVAGAHHYNIVVPFVSGDDAPNGILGVALDITDRKRAEDAVAAEKERLAVTLRSIGDGVITTDTSGQVTMMNRMAEVLTGWRADEACGKSSATVFHVINELTRERLASPVELVLETGDIYQRTNAVSLISKDGHEIAIADSGAPIRDNFSKIVGAVIVFRDISEKRRLQDSQQRAQRLESLGVLAGGIAHDFNNLLAGVFGYMELARDGVEEGNYQHIPQHLDNAMGVFERARALTQQLLTFSKGGTPILKVANLAPLIEKSTLFALSGSNVVCLFDIADNLHPCECDVHQMGQVIDNIVINAKQSMAAGGTLRVRAQNVFLERSQIPVSPGDGNFVKISIQDEGVGIPRELLTRIFDPFFSTRESGHGLGLATVHSIVQRHDGWLEVESTHGTGSTFHIYLHAVPRRAQSKAPESPFQYQGKGAILVMDDEDFMRDIVGKMLSSLGHEVVFAKDGDEALSLFTEAEDRAKSFAACLLDLTIPGGMGGKEVVAKMRRINPNTVLIAASGYSEDPVMANPLQYSFTDRIIKPFRKTELITVLKLHLPPR